MYFVISIQFDIPENISTLLNIHLFRYLFHCYLYNSRVFSRLYYYYTYNSRKYQYTECPHIFITIIHIIPAVCPHIFITIIHIIPVVCPPILCGTGLSSAIQGDPGSVPQASSGRSMASSIIKHTHFIDHLTMKVWKLEVFSLRHVNLPPYIFVMFIYLHIFTSC